MRELDLIPADYRRFLAMSSLLRRFLTAFVLVLVIGAVVQVGLLYQVKQEQQAIRTLEVKKSISSHQREVLERLKSDEESLEDKLKVLESLRGGVAAKQMFEALDRTLDGSTVWFSEITFKRAGSIIPKGEEAVNTGYFIVIPKGQAATESPAWRIQTHMTLHGQALDHSALSTFVKRLLTQPEIGTVRVLNTHSRQYTQTTVVDFELAVVVNSAMVDG